MDTTEDRDCGADAAAYVLGSLEHDEAEAFRAHLQTCAVCRDEVSAFGTVVDALPLGAPPHPAPRGLRRRVMTEVNADARAQQPRRSRAARGGWAALPRPALALATGLAAMAAIVIASSIGGGSPSARLIHASTSWPGSTAVVQIRGSSAELVVARMPAAPHGKVYEVWLKRGGSAPEPTNALFGVTGAGNASVDVPGNLHGVTQVMVTPEPAGGSTVPTHAPVVVANL